MTGMLQPIVAGSAKFNYRSLFHQEGAVGRMHGMTGITVPLLNRIMDEGPLRRPYLPGCILHLLFFYKFSLHRHGIGVTVRAKTFSVCRQKFFRIDYADPSHAFRAQISRKATL